LTLSSDTSLRLLEFFSPARYGKIPSPGILCSRHRPPSHVCTGKRGNRMQKLQCWDHKIVVARRRTLDLFFLRMLLLKPTGGVVVTRLRTVPVLCCLVAAVAGFSLPNPTSAASCDAIVGQWTWFTGGVVTMHPDGTMVHELGNDGTWECTDNSRGRVTLRWRSGGYVNRVALSADGQGLSSLDPSQMFVTAKKVGGGTEAKKATQQSKQPPPAGPGRAPQKGEQGWTPMGPGGFGRQAPVPLGPGGIPQRIGPQGRPPPKGAG
jgi:hypothetical protein